MSRPAHKRSSTSKAEVESLTSSKRPKTSTRGVVFTHHLANEQSSMADALEAGMQGRDDQQRPEQAQRVSTKEVDNESSRRRRPPHRGNWIGSRSASDGILGFNSPEWMVCDVAAIFAGGLPTGIYTTSKPDACQFVANNCSANVICVEDEKQLAKILQIRDQLPHLKAIVQYKGKLSQQYPNVLEWDQFMELGKDVDDSVIEEKIKAQRPEQCALLVYTSGTTGDPKGVMLSHDNITWTLKAIKSTFNLGFGEDHGVSYMPLSHTAGQISEVFMPLLLGGTVHFAQPDALKGTLLQTIREARPTYFYSVPRVWEKIKEGFEAQSHDMGFIKKAIFSWATQKGIEGNTNIQQHLPLPYFWSLADSVVYQKVRTTLGLDRCKNCICGSAPVSLEVLRFFMSVNIPLLEFYGMSESSGPQTFNVMDHWRLGSVGINMVGAKTKIDKPDENGDGEVREIVRHIFMGYLNDEEKTKEAIDEEGWLHSGDVGRIDQDGFLYVTGRIKELVITSGGKNIAPVPIEDAIKEKAPFLSNVMVVGDHRKYISCLVTLKVTKGYCSWKDAPRAFKKHQLSDCHREAVKVVCVMNPETGEPTDDLLPQAIDMIAALGSHCTKVSEVVQQQDQAVYAAIQKGLDKVNEHAETTVHTVKKFTLLDTDFSIPGGELGPTLKLKRSVAAKKYAEKIDAMYAGDENPAESIKFFKAIPSGQS
eukprot:Em0022g496a